MPDWHQKIMFTKKQMSNKYMSMTLFRTRAVDSEKDSYYLDIIISTRFLAFQSFIILCQFVSVFFIFQTSSWLRLLGPISRRKSIHPGSGTHPNIPSALGHRNDDVTEIHHPVNTSCHPYSVQGNPTKRRLLHIQLQVLFISDNHRHSQTRTG